jgi:hypothetical protein
VVRGAPHPGPPRRRAGAEEGARAHRRGPGQAAADRGAGRLRPPPSALRGGRGRHRRLPAALAPPGDGTAVGRLQGQGAAARRPAPGGGGRGVSGARPARPGRARRPRLPLALPVQPRDRRRAGGRPRPGEGGAGRRRLSLPGRHAGDRRGRLAATGGAGPGGAGGARRPGRAGAHAGAQRPGGAAAGRRPRPHRRGRGERHRPPGALRRDRRRLPPPQRRRQAPGAGPGDPQGLRRRPSGRHRPDGRPLAVGGGRRARGDPGGEGRDPLAGIRRRGGPAAAAAPLDDRPPLLGAARRPRPAGGGDPLREPCHLAHHPPPRRLPGRGAGRDGAKRPRSLPPDGRRPRPRADPGARHRAAAALDRPRRLPRPQGDRPRRVARQQAAAAGELRPHPRPLSRRAPTL